MNHREYSLFARHLADSRLDMGEIEEAMSALFPALEEDNREFDREQFRAEVWKERDRVTVNRALRKLALA